MILYQNSSRMRTATQKREVVIVSGDILPARRPLFCATVAVNSRPLVVFRFRAVVLAVGGMGGRGCQLTRFLGRVPIAKSSAP